MVRYFREADRLRKEQQNEFLWLQGLYNHESLCAALTNAFSKHKKAEYPQQPHPVYKRELTQEEKLAEEQKQIEEQRKKMHDYLDSVVKAYKARKNGREAAKEK